MLETIVIRRTYIVLLLLIIAAAAVGPDLACREGWQFAACTSRGLSIFPPAGSGEFALSEVLSLTVIMIGVFITLAAYTSKQQPHKRLASVFLILFVLVYLGESNLLRDDGRAPLLALTLVWLSIELLCCKRILPIIVLFAATVVAFLGSLGDHTMLIQFQHFTGEKISQSPLAGAQAVIGPLEEITELSCWLLYVVAALLVFPVRITVSNYRWFLTLLAFAIIAISVGDTFLYLRQTHELEGARKAGLFTAFAGVMTATAAFYLCMARSSKWRQMLARSHAALFGASIWFVAVLAPTIYTHEHNKTVSYATWALPLLVLYFYLHYTSRQYRAIEEQRAND